MSWPRHLPQTPPTILEETCRKKPQPRQSEMCCSAAAA
jgi:hypothetical protein